MNYFSKNTQIKLFLRYVIIVVLGIEIIFILSGETKASNKTEITVDVSQNLGQMPRIAAVGMDFSQWGNDFYKFYFRKKYKDEIQNIGSIYRTGLNLRYHVSDLSGNTEKFTDFLNDLDNITSSYEKSGANLIFTIYGMPMWLSKSCEKNGDEGFVCEPNWGAAPPTDYDAWAEHVKGIVSHYKHELGLDLLYEIWNEPDQGYLFSNTNFWLGSQEEYFKLYEYSVKGAREADPNVKIGGPASSVWDKGAIEEFIKYAAKNNLPIDFITWHLYVGWNNFWGTTSEYKEMAENIKKWLKQYGYDENTPLIIDEWNNDASLSELEDHTTERNSAYAVYAIYNMLDAGIDKQAFFNFVDFHHNPLFSGSTGIMSNTGIIKSVYNAFEALAITQGKSESKITDRLKVDITGDDACFLAAIASQTKNKRKVRILISNYIPTDAMLRNAFPPEVYPCALLYRENPREIILNLKNMPFSGDATMITYLVDKDHANSCRYNKKTEEVQTDFSCGSNGTVDKSVMQAQTESEEKAFSEANYYLQQKGYTETQIEVIMEQFGSCFSIDRVSLFKDCISPSLESTCTQVMELGTYPPDCNVFEQDVIDCNRVYYNTYDDLYFSGRHAGLSGQTITVSTWINKINNDPNISLEGSKQKKQIGIVNGSYQEVITLQPDAVFLVEITLPQTADY